MNYSLTIQAYVLQAQNHRDESAFVCWELAESGIEFVQSNLAELLDGGGQPLSVQSQVDKKPLGLIRSIMSRLPGIRTRIAIPTALFSLDHRPSKNIHITAITWLIQKDVGYISLNASVTIMYSWACVH